MRTKPTTGILSLFGCLFLYMGQADGQCFSTSWQNAASFTTDNTIGVYDFSTPSNAQTSDNSRASASSLIAILSGNTYYLKATGFNFSIPSYASICGVTVEVESRATGLLLTAAVRDNDVKLVKGNVITGNNKALPGDWGSADSYRSYGGASDLWGATLTPADVNAPDFGVAFSASIIALVAALPDAEIDHIRMKIDYNPVLPVKLEYFTASQKDNLISLEWKTTEEEDGAIIILQRSVNSNNWEDIRHIELSGYHHQKVYNHTDNITGIGTYQYRLCIIPLSGQASYSAIRHVMINKEEQLKVYPNPARDHIKVNAENVAIQDVWGRQWDLPVTVSHTTSMICINRLPAGIYFVNSNNRTVKIIKD